MIKVKQFLNVAYYEMGQEEVRRLYYQYTQTLHNPTEQRVWEVLKRCGINSSWREIYVGIGFITTSNRTFSFAAENPIDYDVEQLIPDFPDLLLTHKALILTEYAEAVHNATKELWGKLMGKLKTYTSLPGYNGKYVFCDLYSYQGGYPGRHPWDDPGYVAPEGAHEGA